MDASHTRTVVRRLCYGAFPLAAVLIVPSFALMPNRKHDVPLAEADLAFQIGFGMAAAGVGLAVLALLILVLEAEDTG